MQYLKFILSLVLTVLLCFLLGKSLTLRTTDSKDPSVKKETSIPPLGHFFSPFSGFWKNAEPAVNLTSMEIKLPELAGKAKVLFDERMVPHIFADRIEDAVFVQGYITAMNRLWQMDMTVRSAGGTLAEVLGANLIAADKLQRRRGMLVGAERTVESWKKSPEEYAILEAYSAGVNAFVRQMDASNYPLEFKLLNYQPELWSTLKSALVKKYMDQTLCFSEEDIESTNALQILGPELFKKLYPEYNKKQSPVIPANTKWNFQAVKPAKHSIIPEAIGLIDYQVYPKVRHLVGSNNWAVGPSKTASGNPILCNDPHLKLSLPSIWYEIQIHTPESNSYGVSIPGIPGILIGFNENIAWGETNVGHDVLDWYKIDWTDAGKTSYQYDGSLKQAELIVEKIKVKGVKEPILDTVKWTVWGPIVYENSDNPREGLAMRWQAHDGPQFIDIATFIGLIKSKNYDDYLEALQHYDYPAQNFVFASKSGDIAITVNGLFPIKNKSQGKFVQDGSLSSNSWQGWIPREQVPLVRNPSRGFVASANQHSTDPSYPYYYNSASFDHFRGRYLANRLTELDSIVPADMMALQNDNFSLHASEGLAALLKQVNRTSLNKSQLFQLDNLGQWDYRFEADKTEPILYLNWWEKYYKAVFDEVLIWSDSMAILMPENWRLMELTAESPTDKIFDVLATPQKETAREVATSSFTEAYDEINEQLKLPGFNWASKKKTSIMHLARIPSFSKENLFVGGYKNALNAIDDTHGPSWRMVVELGDEIKAWGVYPGGQSGNPGSTFYDTGVDKWVKGEYYELFFMKTPDDNRKAIRKTLTFN